MRIVFVCTGNVYTPSMLYKENYFIKAAVNMGHEVLVLASVYEYIDGVRAKVAVCDDEVDGYRLVRMSYKNYLGSEYFSEKIRNAVGLTSKIVEFNPDYIFYNCPQIFNIKEIGEIKKRIPSCKIALDFSTKYINSARNPLSLYVLHKGIYKHWLKQILDYVDKIYYVSEETLDFLREVYDLPEEMMVENGLPGEVCAYGEREKYRNMIIQEYNMPSDSVIMLHSGKIGTLKRTVEMLEEFCKNRDERFRLLIAGSIEECVKKQIMDYVNTDDRITYFGFVTGEKLTELLCGTDIYLQPGTISQTSQTAICCGCPIMFMDCPTNQDLYSDNGFLLHSLDEMREVFATISENPQILKGMSEKSYELAKDKLEYQSLFLKALIYAGVDV